MVEPQCRQRGAALLAASQCCAPLLPLGPPGPPGVSSSLVDVILGEIAGDGVDTGDGLLGNAGGGYLAGAGILTEAETSPVPGVLTEVEALSGFSCREFRCRSRSQP